jgi:hypothetical protein
VARVICRVPIRLVSPLNGAHGHWSQQASNRKRQRTATWVAWLEAKMPRQLEPGQRVKITRVGPRELDGDNLQSSAKSVRDEVAKLLGINDKLDVWEYDQAKGDYGVELEIL